MKPLHFLHLPPSMCAFIHLHPPCARGRCGGGRQASGRPFPHLPARVNGDRTGRGHKSRKGGAAGYTAHTVVTSSSFTLFSGLAGSEGRASTWRQAPEHSTCFTERVSGFQVSGGVAFLSLLAGSRLFVTFFRYTKNQTQENPKTKRIQKHKKDQKNPQKVKKPKNQKSKTSK